MSRIIVEKETAQNKGDYTMKSIYIRRSEQQTLVYCLVDEGLKKEADN